MKLTSQFVNALLVLKEHGYERVCSTVYNHQGTTYVQFWGIDELISKTEKDGAVLIRADGPPPRRAMQRTLFKTEESKWHGFTTLGEMTDRDVRTGDVFKVAGKFK
jgi:hypothetical protein